MVEIEILKEKLEMIKMYKEELLNEKENIEKELKRKEYSIKVIKNYHYIYKYDKKKKSWEYIGPLWKVADPIEKEKIRKIQKLENQIEMIKEKIKQIDERLYEIEEMLDLIIKNNYEKNIKEIVKENWQ
jgi:DNA-binding transcriptional MerR regulator